MGWTAEQLQIAERLDAEVQRLVRDGNADDGIFFGMFERMPDFKRRLDAGDVINELCGTGAFPRLLRYAKILEMLATEMDAGRITVPD